MSHPRLLPVGGLLTLTTVFFVVAGIALAATSYPDPRGDVAERSGPDLVGVRVSNTETVVTFRVRFAHAPPLRVSARQGWVDMVLVGIDVPPLGPRPVAPAGEWRGADFAFGAHGPATRGQVVRLRSGPTGTRRVATVRIVVSGATLTFSIPRRVLGNPQWFTFSVTAARETDASKRGDVDLAPARGTFRYALT